MQLSFCDRFRLFIVTAVLFLIDNGVRGHEYGSYHNSHPPFHYIRSRFTCISQHKKVLWDTIVVEVHPGASEGCHTTVQHSQAPELWSSIDMCINDGEPELVEECWMDGEFGIVYQVNKTKLISNQNITFPCVQESDDLPEITAIHLIYNCKNGQRDSVHPEDDIMTSGPRLPPIPPHSDSGSTLPPPPSPPEPTMIVDHTDLNTPGHGHIVVTEVEVTTTSAKAISTTTRKIIPVRQVPSSEEDEPVKNEKTKESKSHPITYNELAVIVGPSVAAIAVLILVLVAVIIFVKRKSLKLPGDLQGESLFYSRRFSTASQLSDISVNGQQLRTVP